MVEDHGHNGCEEKEDRNKCLYKAVFWKKPSSVELLCSITRNIFKCYRTSLDNAAFLQSSSFCVWQGRQGAALGKMIRAAISRSYHRHVVPAAALHKLQRSFCYSENILARMYCTMMRAGQVNLSGHSCRCSASELFYVHRDPIKEWLVCKDRTNLILWSIWICKYKVFICIYI